MTPELLRAATGCTQERAAEFAPYIAETCQRYAINTPARQAAFLAQIGHESGSLRWVSEIWGPTPAQIRYEGRVDLGNTQPGDGQRFKGRGLIQTTGRANYVSVRDRLRAEGIDAPDFEALPQSLELPRWAALSAGDYWDMKQLNRLADLGDFDAITRRINGGTNGQADRRARHARALAALAEPITETKEQSMPIPAIVAAVLPSIISSIPALAGMFGSGSEVSQRNAKAAEIAVGIVTEAVGARNAQEAAEILQSDPAAVKVAQAAIEERRGEWELREVGGGIVAARTANAATTDPKRNLALWVTVLMLPLLYMTVAAVLWGEGWSQDVRAMVVAAIVSGLLGAITGYWLGTSFSSSKKDDRAAA